MRYLRLGWKTAKQHTLLIFGLFAYEFVWAFLLLKAVQDAVGPLLHRYPGGISEYAKQLFLAESQFVLTRTNAANHYLLLLFILVILRMASTPLIRAGLFHAVHRSTQNSAGQRFFPGVRKLGKPFAFIYGTQIICIIGPLVWLYVHLAHTLTNAENLSSWALRLLPYAAGFILYAILLQLLVTFVQFGKTTGHGTVLTVMVFMRCVHIAAAVAAMIALCSLLVYALIAAATYFWAGLAAVILHFIHQFLRIVLNVWRLAAQYHVWLNYVR